MNKLFNDPIMLHSDSLLETESAFKESFHLKTESFSIFPRTPLQPTWRFPAHYHQQIEIFFSLGAKGNCRCDSGEYRLQEFESILIPGSSIHDYELNSCHKSNDLFLIIDSNQFGRTFQNIWDKPVILTRDSEASVKAQELLARLSLLSRGALSPLMQLSILFELLDLYYRKDIAIPRTRANTINPAIQHLIDLIKDDLSSNLSIKELGNSCGISPWHMCRVFKSYTGMSITEYKNQLRLELAVKLLISGERVTDTAYEVGFQSISYFIKLFSARFGMTPGKYRRTQISSSEESIF